MLAPVFCLFSEQSHQSPFFRTSSSRIFTWWKDSTSIPEEKAGLFTVRDNVINVHPLGQRSDRLIDCNKALGFLSFLLRSLSGNTPTVCAHVTRPSSYHFGNRAKRNGSKMVVLLGQLVYLGVPSLLFSGTERASASIPELYQVHWLAHVK